jgi:hypothetical protein
MKVNENMGYCRSDTPHGVFLFCISSQRAPFEVLQPRQYIIRSQHSPVHVYNNRGAYHKNKAADFQLFFNK